MKVYPILLAAFIGTAACGSLNAQVAAPAGAGDKTIGDRNIKDRSIELERIDHDADKTGNGKPAGRGTRKGREFRRDQAGFREHPASVKTK